MVFGEKFALPYNLEVISKSVNFYNKFSNKLNKLENIVWKI